MRRTISIDGNLLQPWLRARTLRTVSVGGEKRSPPVFSPEPGPRGIGVAFHRRRGVRAGVYPPASLFSQRQLPQRRRRRFLHCRPGSRVLPELSAQSRGRRGRVGQTVRGMPFTSETEPSMTIEVKTTDHPRSVSESRSEYTEICLPNDTNMLGTMLGGRVMHLVDICGAIAAMRHARGPVVTASVDQMTFLHPIRVGELVRLKSQV